eukprot:GHVS01020451.1.p1 GENE.GHVS01020451.1~~GHVS01020451.1.p1  ORF type:complete len:344 (-),score=22.97 GHVS01020451.1:473-1366(-)
MQPLDLSTQHGAVNGLPLHASLPSQPVAKLLAASPVADNLAKRPIPVDVVDLTGNDDPMQVELPALIPTVAESLTVNSIRQPTRGKRRSTGRIVVADLLAAKRSSLIPSDTPIAAGESGIPAINVMIASQFTSTATERRITLSLFPSDEKCIVGNTGKLKLCFCLLGQRADGYTFYLEYITKANWPHKLNTYAGFSDEFEIPNKSALTVVLFAPGQHTYLPSINSNTKVRTVMPVSRRLWSTKLPDGGKVAFTDMKCNAFGSDVQMQALSYFADSWSTGSADAQPGTEGERKNTVQL